MHSFFLLLCMQSYTLQFSVVWSAAKKYARGGSSKCIDQIVHNNNRWSQFFVVVCAHMFCMAISFFREKEIWSSCFHAKNAHRMRYIFKCYVFMCSSVLFRFHLVFLPFDKTIFFSLLSFEFMYCTWVCMCVHCACFRLTHNIS